MKQNYTMFETISLISHFCHAEIHYACFDTSIVLIDEYGCPLYSEVYATYLFIWHVSAKIIIYNDAMK